MANATLTIHPTDQPSTDAETIDILDCSLNLLEPLAANVLTTPLTSQRSIAVGDATLQMELQYTPSRSDVRAALHELLNAAIQRKTSARDALQKSAAPPPATKRGFLESKKGDPPSTLAVATATVLTWGPRVKNYVIFGAFCILANYHGYWWAIPPPV